MSARFALFLPAVLFLSIPAVADEVPTFDVKPSCEAAAEAAGAQEGRLQSCIQSEQQARQQLVQQWTQFRASDRALCSKTASAGGMATYTELITCLEMARDTEQPKHSESDVAPSSVPAISGAHHQPTPESIDHSEQQTK